MAVDARSYAGATALDSEALTDAERAVREATRRRFGVTTLSTSSREPVDVGLKTQRASVVWAYRAVDPTESVAVADSTPRRTGELVIEHQPGFEPMSVFYQPWMELATVDGWTRLTLGTFYCGELPGLESDGTTQTRTIRLAELSGRFVERRLNEPLSLAVGTNVVQWVKDDLQRRFREPDVSGIPASTVQVGDQADWNHDDLVFKRDEQLINVYDRLLSYAGYEPLRVDKQGRPVSQAARDFADEDTAWTFGLPQGTGITPEVSIKPVTPEIPNEVRFVARNHESLGPSEGYSQFTLRNENDGPGSVNQRGRVVEQTVTVDADSPEELKRIALHRAPIMFAGGGWTLAATARAVPLLDDAPVVSLSHSVGVSGRWLVTRYGFQVTAGEESASVDMDLEAELLVGTAFVQGMAGLPAVATSKVAWRGVAA